MTSDLVSMEKKVLEILFKINLINNLSIKSSKNIAKPYRVRAST